MNSKRVNPKALCTYMPYAFMRIGESNTTWFGKSNRVAMASVVNSMDEAD